MKQIQIESYFNEKCDVGIIEHQLHLHTKTE